jgi:hypothetical protein
MLIAEIDAPTACGNLANASVAADDETWLNDLPVFDAGLPPVSEAEAERLARHFYAEIKAAGCPINDISTMDFSNPRTQMAMALMYSTRNSERDIREGNYFTMEEVDKALDEVIYGAR